MDNEAQRIFKLTHDNDERRNFDVNLNDLGDEAWKEDRRMKHMYTKDKDGNL